MSSDQFCLAFVLREHFRELGPRLVRRDEGIRFRRQRRPDLDLRRLLRLHGYLQDPTIASTRHAPTAIAIDRLSFIEEPPVKRQPCCFNEPEQHLRFDDVIVDVLSAPIRWSLALVGNQCLESRRATRANGLFVSGSRCTRLSLRHRRVARQIPDLLNQLVNPVRGVVDSHRFVALD